MDDRFSPVEITTEDNNKFIIRFLDDYYVYIDQMIDDDLFDKTITNITILNPDKEIAQECSTLQKIVGSDLNTYLNFHVDGITFYINEDQNGITNIAFRNSRGDWYDLDGNKIPEIEYNTSYPIDVNYLINVLITTDDGLVLMKIDNDIKIDIEDYEDASLSKIISIVPVRLPLNIRDVGDKINMTTNRKTLALDLLYDAKTEGISLTTYMNIIKRIVIIPENVEDSYYFNGDFYVKTTDLSITSYKPMVNWLSVPHGIDYDYLCFKTKSGPLMLIFLTKIEDFVVKVFGRLNTISNDRKIFRFKPPQVSTNDHPMNSTIDYLLKYDGYSISELYKSDMFYGITLLYTDSKQHSFYRVNNHFILADTLPGIYNEYHPIEPISIIPYSSKCMSLKLYSTGAGISLKDSRLNTYIFYQDTPFITEPYMTKIYTLEQIGIYRYSKISLIEYQLISQHTARIHPIPNTGYLVIFKDGTTVLIVR
jgi:hypothetical protein